MTKTINNTTENLPRSLKIGLTGLVLGMTLTLSSVASLLNQYASVLPNDKITKTALKYGILGLGLTILSLAPYRSGLLEERRPKKYGKN